MIFYLYLFSYKNEEIMGVEHEIAKDLHLANEHECIYNGNFRLIVVILIIIGFSSISNNKYDNE